MTQTEHRLVKLAEECNEVGQRCTKAIRFGIDEIQADHHADNKQRIRLEMAGLVAAYNELMKHDNVFWPTEIEIEQAREKQEKYRLYSEQLGTLTLKAEAPL